MKIIIAGSRDFSDYALLKKSVDEICKGSPAPIIISGGAKGADALGERYAQEHDLELIRVPAQWNKYGRAAGPKRNAEMAKLADALIAFWDGKSSGTKNMIDEAKKRGLKIHVVSI